MDIVIIDDGSQQEINIANLRKEYKLGRIYYKKQQTNKGIAQALNVGIDFARKNEYKYIARLDAGDICCANKYSKQYRYLKKNNWEFRLRYLNQQEKRFPPGYNIYLRFLSETGFVGFLIFVGLLLQIFFWCYNNFSKHNIYSIIIFISMIGFSMNWLKMDSLRIYCFWLCLAIIFALDSKKLENA